MKSKRCSDVRLHGQIGRDARKIHQKVRKMIKTGASTREIESAVARILSFHLADQLQNVSVQHGKLDNE